MFLSSCSKDAETFLSPTPNYKYKMSDLPESSYYLGEDTVCFFPYEDKIYKIGNEVGVYDILADMKYLKLCEAPEDKVYDIYVTSKGIFVLCETSTCQIGFDGKTIKKYALPKHDGNKRDTDICVTEEYIVTYCNVDNIENDDCDNYIFATDLNSGETEEYNMNDEIHGYIQCFSPGQNPDEVFIVKDDYFGDDYHNKLYESYIFDVKTGKMKKVNTINYSFSGIDYNADKNTMYISNDKLKNVSGKINFSLCNPESNELMEYNTADVDIIYINVKSAVKKAGADLKYMSLTSSRNAFATGYDYIMWDARNKTIVVLDLMKESEDLGENLTILYPKSYNSTELESSGFDSGIENNRLDRAYVEPSQRFGEEYDVKINAENIEISQFNEKIRMKFLANEDNFDIVYHDNVNHMLPQILNYQLYLPLEKYEKIATAYDNDYIEGVKDIMSWNGHIYGVPYKISGDTLGVSKTFEIRGMPTLDRNYTFDDFWKLCEVIEKDYSDLKLTYGYKFFKNGILNIIEDGAVSGNLDKVKIVEFINNYLYYKEKDILCDDINSPTLLNSQMTPFMTSSSGFMNVDVGILEDMYAYPSPSGKHYYTVNSMIYANHLTKNPDLSVEYLAFLMSAEISPLLELFKTYFWKNPDDYFTRKFNGDNEAYDLLTEPTDDAYTWVEYPVIIQASDNFKFKYVPNALVNAAPRLYSSIFDEYVFDIRIAIEEGTMTLEEAADKLCEKVNYKMLE